MKKRNLFLLLVVIIGIIPIVNASHIEEGEDCPWVQAPIITSQQELRLWGFAPDDIWAATRDPGGPNAGTWQHYDGVSWTEFQTVALDLIGLWGDNSLDIWTAVGTTGTVGPKHYTGTSWVDTTVSTSGTRTWRSFWGPSATEVYGVHSGSAGTDAQRIFLWDGLIWTLLPTSPSTKGIFDIWGFSSTDIWITGNDGVGGNQFLMHYDGLTWSNFAFPVGYVAGGNVWGDNTNDLWVSAIGTPEGILHIVNGIGTIEEFPISSGGGAKIFGTSSDNVYFGRNSGIVFHWDGSTITTLDNADGVNLNAIWAADTENVWIAGNSGYLAKEECHQCQLDIVNLTIPTLFVFIIFLGFVAFIARKMVGG